MIFTYAPVDIVDTVVNFLAPCDFYNLKSVIPLHDSQYWSHQPALDYAVRHCASLARWCAGAYDVSAAVRAVPHSHDDTTACAVYAVVQHSAVLNAVIAHRPTAFARIVHRYPAAVTQDTLDAIYFREAWPLMASAFKYAPRAFIAYMFGQFSTVVDPDAIAALGHIAERAPALRIIIYKYHDWIWRERTSHDALSTIAAIHKLRLFTFDPDKYMRYAVAATRVEYLEYLIIRGAQVTVDMIAATHDIDKLRLLYEAYISQRYTNLLMVVCAIVAIALFYAKIEKRVPAIQNGYENCGDVLFDSKAKDWKFGISLSTERTFSKNSIADISNMRGRKLPRGGHEYGNR